MVTPRYFSGSRDLNKRSPASELMRLEIRKKGKMPAADRYKRLLKQKFEENKKKVMVDTLKGSRLPKNLAEAKKISKRAENALKEMAAKKAAKQARADRKMVIVEKRIYPNGRITEKGKIFDIAGNIVAEVNVKNGKIATLGGWGIGKYKPKHHFTNMLIQDAINKYSPYYINLRKLQAMQENGGVMQMQEEVINVHGRMVAPPSDNNDPTTMPSPYGVAMGGPRQNIGVNAWGAQSDNVWGTFADNAWGLSMDNVWGGNSTDVWGGIGGNPWGAGAKSIQVWGTGTGVNYLKKLTSFVAAFFGLKTKNSRAAYHEAAQKAISRSNRARATVTRSTTTTTRR